MVTAPTLQRPMATAVVALGLHQCLVVRGTLTETLPAQHGGLRLTNPGRGSPDG